MQRIIHPHIVIFAKYDGELFVHERIVLPKPYAELVLRKPGNLSYLEIKDSERIIEEQENLHVFFKKKNKEIELQYAINVRESLLLEWITAPKECYTLDATIRTPLPLKSIINATMYGFHVWGKYSYSRWINSIPRRNYVLIIGEYFVTDDKNYIIASLDENFLGELRVLANNVYSISKDIIPWNRPVIIHNDRIANRVSTNIVFIRELSRTNMLTLLIQSLVSDLEKFPKIDKLVDTIHSLINGEINYEINAENPYMGLAKFYGREIIRILLEKALLTCPNNIKQLINTIFGEPLSNVILSLLQRDECQITLDNNKIKCSKGPCIVILEKEDIDFLKTILMDGDELILNIDATNRIKVYVF